MYAKQIDMRLAVVHCALRIDSTSTYRDETSKRETLEALSLDGFDMNSDDHFCMFLPTGETEIHFETDEKFPDKQPGTPINFDFSYLLEDGKKYDKPRLIISTSKQWGSECYHIMRRYGDWLIAILSDNTGYKIREKYCILHKTGAVVGYEGICRRSSMSKIARELNAKKIGVDQAHNYIIHRYN